MKFGMLAVFWDRVTKDDYVYKRVQILGKPELSGGIVDDFNVLAQVIDGGYVCPLPCNRLLLLDERFVKIPRRVFTFHFCVFNIIPV
jgi:hypothetical protein